MKGTRVLLRQILADVAAGVATSDIIVAYPSLNSDHVRAAIAFAGSAIPCRPERSEGPCA
jgi:uncharacterized protein (DUF433 family)